MEKNLIHYKAEFDKATTIIKGQDKEIAAANQKLTMLGSAVDIAEQMNDASTEIQAQLSTSFNEAMAHVVLDDTERKLEAMTKERDKWMEDARLRAENTEHWRDKANRLQDSAGFCDQHQPDGGVRNCLVCGIIKLGSALSQICTIIEGPGLANSYDVAQDEERVVEQVKKLKEHLTKTETTLGESSAKVFESNLRIKTLEGVIAVSEEERLKWKRRYEEKEKPTLALARELQTALENIRVADSIGATFWTALKILKLKEINVLDPGSHFTERIEWMQHTLEAVLIFFSESWDEDKMLLWELYTGSKEATSRNLCEAIRKVLATFVNETPPDPSEAGLPHLHE